MVGVSGYGAFCFWRCIDGRISDIILKSDGFMKHDRVCRMCTYILAFRHLRNDCTSEIFSKTEKYYLVGCKYIL